MITIDLVDSYDLNIEKPPVSKCYVAPGSRCGILDPLYSLAHSRHQSLLQAAHTARLLKSYQKESVPVDVQRYMEKKLPEIPAVERYVRRAWNLALQHISGISIWS